MYSMIGVSQKMFRRSGSDTTALNTSRIKGSCALLENYSEYLARRCHIYEIVLKSVFDKKLCTAYGPDVPIFKRFQQYWGNLNTEKFERYK